MKCTGQNCPLNLGNVEKCTAHNCEHRTKPKTNYDKITSSEESLAEHLVESISMDLGGLRHRAGDGKLCATWEEAKQRTIEWLQKECEG